jgi:GcrA cell cycle regulator
MASPWEMGGQPLVDRLKELHGNPRLSFAKIAAELSGEFKIRVSRNACIGKATRIGLPIRARTHAERGAIGHARRPKQTGTVKRIIGNRPERVAVYHEQIGLADVIPLHVSFDDLRHGQCRYPYGEGPFTFCGCEALPSLSYCEPHHRLTHGDDRRAYVQHIPMVAEAA